MHPMFEGLGVTFSSKKKVGNLELHDAMAVSGQSWKTLDWKVDSIRADWIPLQAGGRVAPFNDYPCINLCYPCFSENAVQCLRNELEPNGELLPVFLKKTKYYYYHITRVMDVIDVQNSQAAVFEGSGRFTHIDYLAFDEQKLSGCPIFMTRHAARIIVVNQQFVDRTIECGLNGFEFKKLWPLPKGVNWRLNHKAELAKKTAKRGPADQAQSLVIQILFDDRLPKKETKKKIKALENSIDVILSVKSLSEHYYGNLAGRDDLENEVRLFLSCPNAELLFRRLSELLKAESSDLTMLLTKREGGIWDEGAREEKIKF